MSAFCSSLGAAGGVCVCLFLTYGAAEEVSETYEVIWVLIFATAALCFAVFAILAAVAQSRSQVQLWRGLITGEAAALLYFSVLIGGFSYAFVAFMALFAPAFVLALVGFLLTFRG